MPRQSYEFIFRLFPAMFRRSILVFKVVATYFGCHHSARRWCCSRLSSFFSCCHSAWRCWVVGSSSRQMRSPRACAARPSCGRRSSNLMPTTSHFRCLTGSIRCSTTPTRRCWSGSQHSIRPNDAVAIGRSRFDRRQFREWGTRQRRGDCHTIAS